MLSTTFEYGLIIFYGCVFLSVFTFGFAYRKWINYTQICNYHVIEATLFFFPNKIISLVCWYKCAFLWHFNTYCTVCSFFHHVLCDLSGKCGFRFQNCAHNEIRTFEIWTLKFNTKMKKNIERMSAMDSALVTLKIGNLFSAEVFKSSNNKKMMIISQSGNQQ